MGIVSSSSTCRSMSAFPAPAQTKTADRAALTAGSVRVTRFGGGLGESVTLVTVVVACNPAWWGNSEHV